MSINLNLYGHPLSPYSSLIHLTLIYKELDFNFHFIDLASGQQKSTEYLSINPFGQVPALVSGDQAIYESWSIFEFLEESFPTKNMLPRLQPSRAMIRSLSLFLETGVIPAGSVLFRKALNLAKVSDEEYNEKLQILKNKLEIFEKELSAVGKQNHLTPVDGLFYQGWQNLCFSVPTLKDEFPGLDKYFNELKKHAAFQELEKQPEVIQIRQLFAAKK